MENAAVAYEEKPTATGEDLDYILNGLRNDFYIKASNDLAEVVQRRLAAFHPGPNRGVKQAPFKVLVGATMPAALVEVGFISNPEEERRLNDDAYQNKMADAVLSGIKRYFAANPPLAKSRMAMQ